MKQAINVTFTMKTGNLLQFISIHRVVRKVEIEWKVTRYTFFKIFTFPLKNFKA